MVRRHGISLSLISVCTLLLPLVVNVLHANELEKWLLMPGEVVSAHAEFESDCDLCHAPLEGTQQSELCVECHTAVGTDIANSRGFHGRLEADEQSACATCHTDHEGRDFNIALLNNSTFDHSLTDFVLYGAHASASCDSCHDAGAAFRDAPLQCVACHRSDDIHRGDLGDNCSSCHTSGDWARTMFDHGDTDFPLDGGHAGIECQSCHRSTVFSSVGRTCQSCHQADDVHRGQNGTECGSCHSNERWTPATFDHLAVSNFGLVGGHNGLTCQACHRADDHKDLQASTCQSCHGDDDVHQGRFGNSCNDCHSVNSWSARSFDHAGETGFPLPPGHGTLACAACHKNALNDPLPRDCGTCHQDSDPHRGQLGTECENCHVATEWSGKLWFDHDITSFPLIGEHANVACGDCHESAAFRDAEPLCTSCHLDDDPHLGGLGTQCENCHNPASWHAWLFDHDNDTRFPLTGAHVSITCNACHLAGGDQPDGPAQQCVSCHRRDDRHNGRFGDQCDTCHSTETFTRIGMR